MASESLSDDGLSSMIDTLCQVEKVADEILLDKAELVQMDKRRQENRQALRNLQKYHNTNNDIMSKKVYLSFGRTFVRLPTDKARKLIENDQQVLDEEIRQTRAGLRPKMEKLYELEQSDEALKTLAAFKLDPVNSG